MHEHSRYEKLGWTIFLNSVITAAEYIGGVISGSLALISDAGHNFTDVLSLLLSCAGEKISLKKPDKNNSFGLKRFEILTALINAASLWVIGFWIVAEAVKRSHSQEAVSLGWMLSIAVIGLLGNLFSLIILNKDRDSSLNLKAAFLHLFYDLISSVVVIFSAVIIYFTGWVKVDIVAGVFIAAMIFWSGFGIISRAMNIFMQGVPEGIDFARVYGSISAVKGVLSVHGLHIWSINSREVFLSCHVCVDKDNAAAGTDHLIKQINSMLAEEYNISHSAVQVEHEQICSGGPYCCR